MTRADKLVVLFAIILLPYLYLTYWGNGSQGEQVVIQIANQKPQYYSLTQNRKVTIKGIQGETTLEIKDGQVRFIDAPCHNKQCIIAGWLSKDGDVAACLPNGVSARIVGRDSRFDSVNF